MQTGVLAFVVINVDGYFLGQVQRPAVDEFEAFEIGPENVVGLAGGYALGEFAVVIGIQFPPNFLGLIAGSPDLHSNPVKGMIVWSPDCSKDEGVGFFRFGLPLSGTWNA